MELKKQIIKIRTFANHHAQTWCLDKGKKNMTFKIAKQKIGQCMNSRKCSKRVMAAGHISVGNYGAVKYNITFLFPNIKT